ncbi:MAG: amidohydrolase [Candidatus Latescibacteria bacterium]|nr:amidohydrolase [Candidatus Latescibacterota bacterium]
MIIDFHNHYYPEAYLKELHKGDTRARLERDATGHDRLQYAGDYNVVVDGHRNPEARIEEMDRCGVDIQVFSLTTPGVHIEESKRGIRLAQIVNEAFAETVQQYPGRFLALAALPLQDPHASVVELERAVTQLNHRGALVFANVNGQALDAPAYWPLYEKAADLDIPLFLHPTSPAGVEAMQDYRLTALLGFLFDTSLAITRLVFSGVLERYPGLKFVLAHLGGTIPYVAERVDRGYQAYEECRGRITKPPSEYFKQTFLDTVAFQPQALQFALNFAGPDRLVLGSDYPHQIGNTALAVRVIQDLPIPAAEQHSILGGNAARLLKISDR